MKRKLTGPLLVFASGIVWSFSGVLSKGVFSESFAWSGISKTGMRGLVAVFMYAAYRRSFRVKLNRTTIIGALGVCLTSLLYMTAINYTTSANAIVLQYSMPVYVVLYNWVFGGQKPGIKEIITVPLVLAGVVLCCIGSGGEAKNAMLGNILGIASGLTYAFVFIAARFGNTDSVSYTYLGNLFSALMLICLPFDSNVHFGLTSEILNEWLTVLMLGLSLGGGYLLLALGLKEGAAPVTAALLSNVEPVMNPVWVYCLLGIEALGALSIVGCILVLASVTVYSCLPETR